MKNADRTLGDLVVLFPAAAKVFQKHQLDYCCGGKQLLVHACATRSLDVEDVLGEIQATQLSQKTEIRWDQQPLDALIQHVLDDYHAPLRSELPRLIELATQVEITHQGKPACPSGLAELLTQVSRAVADHLAKEEQILFPLILSGRGQMAHLPVQAMVQEHEDHGRNLGRIRQITGDLALPGDACASWRELYRALEELEAELMNHIHLENNILFPRALAG